MTRICPRGLISAVYCACTAWYFISLLQAKTYNSWFHASPATAQSDVNTYMLYTCTLLMMLRDVDTHLCTILSQCACVSISNQVLWITLTQQSCIIEHVWATHAAVKKSWTKSLASFPGLPRFFCSSVSVDNNTRMQKGGEKRGISPPFHIRVLLSTETEEQKKRERGYQISLSPLSLESPTSWEPCLRHFHLMWDDLETGTTLHVYSSRE